MTTCVQCGAGPLREAETMELPNGPTCFTCYEWLERMADEMIERDEI